MTTQAYKNKQYGQVYGLTLDFLKSYILDFYIPTRKTYLILNPESILTLQIKSLLNYTLKTVLISLYPILPYNSEYTYYHSPFRSSKSISLHPWPVKSLQVLNFREDLVEKIELLRKLKLTARTVFQDEKLMKNGFSSYKFQIVIKPSKGRNPSIKSRTIECLEYLSKGFEDVLWDIFECSGVKIEGHTNVDEDLAENERGPYRQEHVSFIYKGYKAKVTMQFFKIVDKGECHRCLRYTRTDPKKAFCGDCQEKVDDNLENIYKEFFNFNNR